MFELLQYIKDSDYSPVSTVFLKTPASSPDFWQIPHPDVPDTSKVMAEHDPSDIIFAAESQYFSFEFYRQSILLLNIKSMRETVHCETAAHDCVHIFLEYSRLLLFCPHESKLPPALDDTAGYQDTSALVFQLFSSVFPDSFWHLSSQNKSIQILLNSL